MEIARVDVQQSQQAAENARRRAVAESKKAKQAMERTRKARQEAI